MREGLTVREASDWIQGVTPELPTETVGGFEAFGRFLAESIVATRQLPPSDCSAMDGYAVRATDLATAVASRPVELPVVDEIPAGAPSVQSLASGQAARIFTGAALPAGADTVVRQEDTERLGDRVRIQIAPQPRAHVREAGEDIRIGEEILAVGTHLSAAELGVLSSLGRSMVAVRRRPRVAILSGGDELVEVDGDIQGGRIVSSNSYSLIALCRALGAEASYLGISKDDPESVERQFRAALGADCIVSSAGVSVGDHDHVRPVLEKLGCRLEFWGVHMKPGYPLAFGRFESGSLVFGLPGNPVSAFVTFAQFVRPALLKMMGAARCFLPTIQARLGETLTKKAGRLHFVRVRLSRDGDAWLAQSTGNQSSGVMRSLIEADGLLIFPVEATELRAGDSAQVQILREDWFSGQTAPF